MEVTIAKREKQKALISMSGVTNSGKTLSALLLSYGMMKKKYMSLNDDDVWLKIGVIDTEHRRSMLYENREFHGVKIGRFAHIDLLPPYNTKRYNDAVQLLKNHGVEIIIIDSLSHNWNGEGGTLEKHGEMTGNSFQNWNKVNGEVTQMVKVIASNDVHVIATLRVKSEYVMEINSKGKQQPRKIGLKPIQKEDIEYEFTTQFAIDSTHMARCLKDNTGLFTNVNEEDDFTITPKLGAELYDFLELGVDVEAERQARKAKIEADRQRLIQEINNLSQSHDAQQIILQQLFRFGNKPLYELTYDEALEVYNILHK